MIHTPNSFLCLPVIFGMFFFLLQSCSNSPDKPVPSSSKIFQMGVYAEEPDPRPSPIKAGEQEKIAKGSEYDEARIQYAEGFRIQYHENYKLLEILQPFQDQQVDTLRYALIPRDSVNEIEVPNAQKIPIPIESIIATSTTHIALTEMLGANDRIIGMVGAEHVYSPDIRSRLKEGTITGFPEGEFNKEVALAMEPDMLMISGGQSSQFDNYRVLVESGVSVFVNAEWLETSPLGKAEWIKVMGALLNREQEAHKQFESIAERYHEMQKIVEGQKDKPLVINNMPYKGAWFVSGGNSYTAKFLRDAGAEYPWFKSETTGGLRKSFEVVYEVGLQADIWLNPGAAASKQEILMTDERFKDFKSFQTGEIYNNNKRMGPTGGNDFWERGVVHPELVLADLIQIFHPDLLPGHTLHFYQKLD